MSDKRADELMQCLFSHEVFRAWGKGTGLNSSTKKNGVFVMSSSTTYRFCPQTYTFGKICGTTAAPKCITIVGVSLMYLPCCDTVVCSP